MAANFVNPALMPQYNPDNSLYGQLLGFNLKRGQGDLANNQAKYYNALAQLEGAKVPYGSQLAEAEYQQALLKNYWKQMQGDKEAVHARMLPGDYASKMGLRGAQAGAANASAALSHTRRAGQEGTNAWDSALRSNPIYQAKTAGGRISPEVMAAISGQAAAGNSPLQMNPVDMQGIPIGAPRMQASQMPMPQGMPMQGGIPFAPQQESPQGLPPQGMIPGAHQEQTMYQKAYPQLGDAIQNKLDKFTLATPGAAQKLQYLNNIKETFQGIDPKAVTAYSGVAGRAALKAQEKIIQGGGVPDAGYVAYKTFVGTDAPILGGQIRQFYGDSIQPEMQKRIEATFNDDNTLKNPETALEQISEIMRIMKNEGKTYAKTTGELKDSAYNEGFGKQWDPILEKREKNISDMQNRPSKNPEKLGKNENPPKKKEAIKKAMTESDIQKAMLETNYDRDEVIYMLEKYGEVM